MLSRQVHPISARLNKAITSRSSTAAVDATAEPQRGDGAIESGSPRGMSNDVVADTLGYKNPSVYKKY